jgi:hypothetical protein
MAMNPAHLHRYRSLADGADKFVKRTILENELFFAAPSSFNDPFDCYPAFDFDATVTEMVNYYIRPLRRLAPQASEIELIHEALAKVHDPVRSPLAGEMQASIQTLHAEHITKTIGVLCLSKQHDEILMWSHYANFHRGICLQFDASHAYFENAHEVRYHAKRPRVNPFRDTTIQMMDAALLAKAEQWRYEEEWRLIHYQNGPGVRKFPPEALTGILLGARITQEDERKVKDWVSDRHYPTQLFRAVQSDTAYSLRIEPA